jgi:hypothetical protein
VATLSRLPLEGAFPAPPRIKPKCRALYVAVHKRARTTATQARQPSEKPRDAILTKATSRNVSLTGSRARVRSKRLRDVVGPGGLKVAHINHKSLLTSTTRDLPASIIRDLPTLTTRDLPASIIRDLSTRDIPAFTHTSIVIAYKQTKTPVTPQNRHSRLRGPHKTERVSNIARFLQKSFEEHGSITAGGRPKSVVSLTPRCPSRCSRCRRTPPADIGVGRPQPTKPTNRTFRQLLTSFKNSNPWLLILCLQY